MENTKKIFYEFRDGSLYELTLDVNREKPLIYSVTQSIYKTAEDLEKCGIKYVNYNKYYSYSRIKPKKLKNPNVLCLELEHYNKNESVLRVDAKSFYEMVEMHGNAYIEIDSIADYIEWIKIYQTVSVFITCEEVLDRYIEKMYYTSNSKKTDKMRLDALHDIAEKSKEYLLKEISAVLRENDDGGDVKKLEDGYKELKTIYENEIKRYKNLIEKGVEELEDGEKREINIDYLKKKNAQLQKKLDAYDGDVSQIKENSNKDKTQLDRARKKIIRGRQDLVGLFDVLVSIEAGDDNKRIQATATRKPSERIKGEAIDTIIQILARYHRDEFSMYYRGVGFIKFPDVPGVFRGDRKYEEDRMYKAMMISFPKEFSGLRYLDRLAKLQHFELATRLLDVSSNPLVALYMACNVIYTGDSEQIDWGEVLLYFMAGEKERAYDSKSILINAALVKVPYDEKTVMYQFIYIHKAYYTRHFGEKDDIIIRNKYQEILNKCVHLACDYGVEATIPQNEKDSLKLLINEVKAREINKKLITKTINEIMEDLEKSRTASDFCWCCMEGVEWPDGDRNWRSVGYDDKFSNYNQEVKVDQYKYLFREVIKAYNDLLITIRRENPAFQNKINLFELLKSFHGNIGMTNERILAQSGSFIISGLENLYISKEMKSTRTENYVRMIIKDKKKIFEELRLFNITDATMLPDITHKAKYILEKIPK